MNLKNKTLLSVAVLLSSMVVSSANAISIDWKGTYRFEWTQVDRPSLAAPYGSKSYGLNYLSLSPKIIATDGITIVSKFDVLANQDAAYSNAQFGQLWGQGWNTGAAYQSNVYAQNQRSTNLTVSQLYLNLNQEYGALVVGRAPIEFGLGITHNAGNGAFDHWADTMDMVGYKFIVDNFFFMPILGRVYDQDVSQGNTVQDTILQLQYESKESGSLIGVMQQTRKASLGANDAPNAGTKTGEFNVQTMSFILGREWEKFGFKLEAGFNSGTLGVQSAALEDIKTNGYGIAAEFYMPRKDSKYDLNVRIGMATGDDPTSTGTYEGFQFDRNYDVAMLMFNHRLGQQDFLTTGLTRDLTKGVSTSLDDESISNALYISPRVSYAWNERMDLNNTLTYAQLLTNPVATNSGFSKDLGFEWDIDLTYKPTDKIQWVNQLGLLFPGAAFKNGTGTGGNLDNAMTYGFATKAAISF
jgi:hypothetical protein